MLFIFTIIIIIIMENPENIVIPRLKAMKKATRYRRKCKATPSLMWKGDEFELLTKE